MSRIKLLLLWGLCQLASVVAAIWMLCAIIAGSHRAWRIALGNDQLANATFGGDEDEFISSRCWRYRAAPGYARWVRLINWVFDDPNHCENSFDDEEAKRQLFINIPSA